MSTATPTGPHARAQAIDGVGALPSVTALSAEYGVSTSTAGRAIRVLADEGKVTTVKGWGVFVSEAGAKG